MIIKLTPHVELRMKQRKVKRRNIETLIRTGSVQHEADGRVKYTGKFKNHIFEVVCQHMNNGNTNVITVFVSSSRSVEDAGKNYFTKKSRLHISKHGISRKHNRRYAKD